MGWGGGLAGRAHHLVAAFGGEKRAPTSLKRLRGRAAGGAAALRVHPGGPAARLWVGVWLMGIDELLSGLSGAVGPEVGRGLHANAFLRQWHWRCVVQGTGKHAPPPTGTALASPQITPSSSHWPVAFRLSMYACASRHMRRSSEHGMERDEAW
eukprot:COSAG04_NODE_6119_length_1404_cov_2.329502_2_plen_153_part_01